jgi:hypothetical protein
MIQCKTCGQMTSEGHIHTCSPQYTMSQLPPLTGPVLQSMKERPILFSAPMVRAILDGSKTQTRRVVTSIAGIGKVTELQRSDTPGYDLIMRDRELRWNDLTERDMVSRSPYGQPSDRLWVKETFYAFGRWVNRFSEKKGRDEWHFVDMTVQMDRLYQFSDPTPVNFRHRSSITPAWWKRPAIFMPRAASRITLDVTGVRVERLQDISEVDAISEGGVQTESRYWKHDPSDCIEGDDPIESFRRLWENINGSYSWDANPWVWVVEFKRIDLAKQDATQELVDQAQLLGMGY